LSPSASCPSSVCLAKLRRGIGETQPRQPHKSRRRTRSRRIAPWIALCAAAAPLHRLSKTQRQADRGSTYVKAVLAHQACVQAAGQRTHRRDRGEARTPHLLLLLLLVVAAPRRRPGLSTAATAGRQPGVESEVARRARRFLSPAPAPVAAGGAPPSPSPATGRPLNEAPCPPFNHGCQWSPPPRRLIKGRWWQTTIRFRAKAPGGRWRQQLAGVCTVNTRRGVF
jgi:hypothetical protein